MLSKSLTINRNSQSSTSFLSSNNFRNSTLLGVLKEHNQFAIFVSLIEKTSLEATLNHPEKYTLFAPTNEAFKKLPTQLLEALVAPRNQNSLEMIISEHLIKGEATVFRAYLTASNGIIYASNRVLIPPTTIVFTS